MKQWKESFSLATPPSPGRGDGQFPHCQGELTSFAMFQDAKKVSRQSELSGKWKIRASVLENIGPGGNIARLFQNVLQSLTRELIPPLCGSYLCYSPNISGFSSRCIGGVPFLSRWSLVWSCDLCDQRNVNGSGICIAFFLWFWPLHFKIVADKTT